MKNLVVVLFSFFLLNLFSCGPDYIYDQSFEIKNSEWAYEDTLDFAFEITDTLKIYNLYLDVEHSTEYSKQNLYVMIHTRFPSGERIKERISLELADKSGQWYGDCDSDWCILRMNIQEGAYFSALGKHMITIEQYMRQDPLPGIKSFALRIEDTGQSRTN